MRAISSAALLSAAIIILLSVNTILAQESEVRTWKAEFGPFEIRARLVEQKDQTVKLRATEDGRIVEVPLEKLSAEDRAFLKDMHVPADEKLVSQAKKLQTAKELSTLAARQYHAETALLLYKLFLRSPDVSAEEKTLARDDYPTIEHFAKEKAVRIASKWLTPPQVAELRDKETKLLQEAETHYSSQKYDLAEKSYLAASSINPDGIQADYRLGIIYALAVRNAVNASKHFDKCVQRRKVRVDSLDLRERANLAATLNNLAISVVRQRQFLTATKHWTHALELGYPSPELLQNVGRFLYLSTSEAKSGQAAHLTITLSSQERSVLEVLYEELKRTANFGSFDSSIGWLYIPLISEGTTSESPPNDPPSLPKAPGPPKTNLRVVGYGTGFVVSPGVILTNAHVAREGDEFELRGGQPEVGNLKAKLQSLSQDPQQDLALLSCPECRLPPLALAAELPKPGAELRLLGYPLPSALGRSLKITRGLVTALPPHQGMVGNLAEFADDLLYDATINPGNSGGPAVNQHGSVVAVNTAILVPQAVGGGYAAGVTSLDSANFLRAEILGHQTVAERESLDWEQAVEIGSASTVQIVVLKAPQPFDPLNGRKTRDREAGKFNALEDPYCMACYGHQKVDCPNNVCGNGTVRDIKTVVETFPNGAQVLKQVPIRVTCKRCSGRAFVDCPFCTQGLDARLRSN